MTSFVAVMRVDDRGRPSHWTVLPDNSRSTPRAQRQYSLVGTSNGHRHPTGPVDKTFKLQRRHSPAPTSCRARHHKHPVEATPVLLLGRVASEGASLANAAR